MKRSRRHFRRLWSYVFGIQVLLFASLQNRERALSELFQGYACVCCWNRVDVSKFNSTLSFCTVSPDSSASYPSGLY